MPGDGLGDEIIAVIVITVIVVSSMTVVFDFAAVVESGEAEVLSPDGWETVDHRISSVPGDVQVDATTGRSIRLDGDPVLSSAFSEPVDGGWAVCATAGLEAEANGTYDLVSRENASVLLQWDAGKWSVYRDNGTHDAVATAPANGTGLEPVCAWESNGTLSIRSPGGSGSAPLSQTASPINASFTWVGRVDEVRVYSAPMDVATADEYLDEPVGTVMEDRHVARFMMDRAPGAVRAYYHDSDPDVPSSATSAAGLAGPELERGVDYQLRGGDFSVKILAGSVVEGAPVVYLAWTGGGSIPFSLAALFGLLGSLLLFVFIVEKVIPLMGDKL